MSTFVEQRLQIFGTGVSVSVGPDDVALSELPAVVANGLARAGYEEVDAHLLGDHLRVTARSQPQELRATLQRTVEQTREGLPASQEAFESAIDVSSGTVKSGTTIVFASGESLQVGRTPMPLDNTLVIRSMRYSMLAVVLGWFAKSMMEGGVDTK